MVRWLNRMRARVRVLFLSERVERQLDDELRSYCELLAERHRRAGMAPEEAMRAALREFDGFDRVKQNVREARVGNRIESWAQDLRYAWRSLRRSPAFLAVAALTLALGIGVNTAVFSVVYAELLRPLPYLHPERLALIWCDFQKTGALHAPASGPLLRELAQRAGAMQEVGGIWANNATFTGDANPEQVKIGQVTPNFLELLGVRAVLGRVFARDEFSNRRQLIVLSYGLWQRRFAGDPKIVGKVIHVNGANVMVLGVLPRDFQLFFPGEANVPADVQAFLPFGEGLFNGPRTLYYVRVVGRIRAGVDWRRAQADLDSAAAQMRGAYTEFADERLRFEAISMQEEAVRNVRPALTALFAGAAFVLLICAANVANLALARSSESRREIAMRAALGASHARILRQLFLESATLCAIGVCGGIALGWVGIQWLRVLRPEHLARIGEVSIDWTALAFAAAAGCGCVLLFGLAPAIDLPKLELFRALRESRLSPTRGVRAARSALIVCEIALGLVLLVGAGLTIRTLANVAGSHPGFEAKQLLTFEIEFPGARYRTQDSLMNFVLAWETKLSSLPGVEAVGATSHLPLDDYPNWYSAYRPAEIPAAREGALLADHRCVTPGYFRAMGTRLIEGRDFDGRDSAIGQETAIVDEMLAREAWPGESAIGKQIESEHFTARGIVPVMATIVGVVEHTRNHSLTQNVRGEIYLPYPQSVRSHLSFAVRTAGDPLALAGAIGRGLREKDRDLALSKMRPMTTYVERALAPASFTALLAAVFAMLAVTLAAIGVYGVVYYSVSQRMHEMGVRAALGASAADLRKLVARQGLTLTATGTLLGLAGSLGVARFLRGLVYGVPVLDPLTYAVALAVISAAALAGCWRPASKAAAANPVDAIRAE